MNNVTILALLSLSLSLRFMSKTIRLKEKVCKAHKMCGNISYFNRNWANYHGTVYRNMQVFLLISYYCCMILTKIWIQLQILTYFSETPWYQISQKSFQQFLSCYMQKAIMKIIYIFLQIFIATTSEMFQAKFMTSEDQW